MRGVRGTLLDLHAELARSIAGGRHTEVRLEFTGSGGENCRDGRVLLRKDATSCSINRSSSCAVHRGASGIRPAKIR